MGCGLGRISFISNSTPFVIKVKVHQNEERVTKFEKEKEAHANIQGGYDVAKVDIGARIAKKQEGVMRYVDEDFKGFIKITPNTTYDIEVPNGTNYISVFVQLSNEYVYELALNYKVTGVIQYLVGLREISEEEKKKDQQREDNINENESKYLEFIEIASELDRWRAKDKRGSQNYYYKRKCCCGGFERCNPNCVDLKRFGGYVSTDVYSPESVQNLNGIFSLGTRKVCAKGHPLVRFKIPSSKMCRCDKCLSNIYDYSHACRLCDYDLCEKCYQT